MKDVAGAALVDAAERPSIVDLETPESPSKKPSLTSAPGSVETPPPTPAEAPTTSPPGTPAAGASRKAALSHVLRRDMHVHGYTLLDAMSFLNHMCTV